MSEKMQVPTAFLPCSFTSSLAQVRQLTVGRHGLYGNPVFDGLDEAWKAEGKLFVYFNTYNTIAHKIKPCAL